VSDEARALVLLGQLEPLRIIEFTKANPESRAATQQAIAELCDLFASADSAERAQIISRVRPNFSFVFFWFARTMAEMAVQKSMPEAVWSGLVALVIEDFCIDYRDSLHRIVLVYHSATKLGLDAEALFSRAAALSGNAQVVAILGRFPLRPPGGRTLGSFLYEETGAGESFSYRKLGEEEFRF
jgi:hypothetical protein